MLGSRKLLIVLCIVPCVLSLLCIGAFAAPAEDLTPSVDIPLETDVVEDAVKSPSALAVETFPAEPLLEYNYYAYNIAVSNLPNNNQIGITVNSLAIYDGVSNTLLFALGDGVVYRNLGSDYISVVFDGVSYRVPTNAFCTFTYSESSFSNGNGTVAGSLVEEALVPDIADSIFSLGDALITFVVSSWVVLIPLAAWLVVLCIGAIRKLVKGV